MANAPLFIYVFSAVVLGLGLVWLLWRRILHSRSRAKNRAIELFKDVLPLLDSTSVRDGEAAGTWLLDGHYKGRLFQFKAIIDNLAPRKLPGLWLMVTRAQSQMVPHTFDLMMRPSGPITFSNFDFLNHNLPRPAEFPDEAVLRADQDSFSIPASIIAQHLSLFHPPIGKELLISPKGLRLVVLLAQADRARYGVLRQAEFNDCIVDAALAQTVLDQLIALENDIAAAYGKHDEK